VPDPSEGAIVTDVAFAELHVSVALLPDVIDAGSTLMLTLGAGFEPPPPPPPPLPPPPPVPPPPLLPLPLLMGLLLPQPTRIVREKRPKRRRTRTRSLLDDMEPFRDGGTPHLRSRWHTSEKLTSVARIPVL
jgi:hypothetical protein